jgi:hypothetical protein
MSAFEECPPYESYAAIVAAFGGLLATAGLASKALGQKPSMPVGARPRGALGSDLQGGPNALARRRHELPSPTLRASAHLSLGAAAANDSLKAGIAALAAKANELDSETS